MPEAHAEQRSAPYASLRAASDADATKARGEAQASSPATPDFLAEEADRLESFKQALFAAFLAAPLTGIPTALVDLAATYTSTPIADDTERVQRGADQGYEGAVVRGFETVAKYSLMSRYRVQV